MGESAGDPRRRLPAVRRASPIAASLGTEVAGLLARTIGWLCEGQIEELRHTYDMTRTETSYLASIHGKTASLYGTAARIGGIVAGHDRPVIDALTEYGNAYGTVFQIVDDILDITATDEQLGKPAGHDMVEGVYTLPVLRTLAVGNASASELADLLGSPLDAVAQEKALAIVRSTRVWHRRSTPPASLSSLPRPIATASPTPRRQRGAAQRPPGVARVGFRAGREHSASCAHSPALNLHQARTFTSSGRTSRWWSERVGAFGAAGTPIAEFVGGDAQGGPGDAVAAETDAQRRPQDRRTAHDRAKSRPTWWYWPFSSASSFG